MANADERHFDSYRAQTKLKHQILVDYLPAYYNALKRFHSKLVYVDGFAGCGHYVEANTKHPGSPILAMELFAKSNDHRSSVKCFFVEANPEFAAALETAVNVTQKTAMLTRPPDVFKGQFADFMAELRTHLSNGVDLAPTFLFVDPCGVDGINLKDLTEVLSRKYCELFLFFNYEGVSRIAGNATKSGSSSTLVALFGSEERVQQLINSLKDAVNPSQSREMILKQFCDALSEAAGAEFLLPFRIEHAEKEKTSHYLLHATKSSLGFKIMKSVMGKAAEQSGRPGGMELLQASNRTSLQLFEHPDFSKMRQSILSELKTGPRKVSVFSTVWLLRPTDMFSEEEYKRVLLELELSGKILVFDKANATPKPAVKRQRRDQVTGITKTTLGNDCWLRIADGSVQQLFSQP